ncbi:MAG: saccharopine dehydrogenase NADP-binding domain-containing protein [Chloroflexi bacterium]|nr:saccharopine dehydrogenase NADP-binding domain-containing protein [Chloroflexota bacterium]
MSNWMLYGAYGYTGKLITEEAVKRGHQPLLAGRNEEKLKAHANQYNLPYAAFNLNDPIEIEKHLEQVDLVLHAAGPLTFTAPPMRKACLKTQTHYLDLTGEISVFEDTFQQDVLAKQAGIVMISGVGYDVVPTDCMACYVKQQLPDATSLEVGLNTGGGSMRASAGTLKSVLEILSNGNLARRDGRLTAIRLGSHVKTMPFRKKDLLTIAIPWGDLSTAYRTTGIPNITTCIALSRSLIRLLQVAGPIGPPLLSITPLRRLLQFLIGQVRKDKKSNLAHKGQTEIYVRATTDDGRSAEGWLVTPEAYVFTALACVRMVEKVLAEKPSGAMSPAQLVGADFVLDIEGCQRFNG